ncbi:MAG TPA: alkyl sulfatase dimerization domain-containing protein, partial [Pseudomonadales bacterium]
VLLEVAETLEKLVGETLEMMNAGRPLNEIIHTVKVAPEILERPYLRPLYDEPEFVVRNVWRMYGGWYDGNPANLKPARDAEVAAELADLAGGAEKLAKRARQLAAEGQLRLACHLVELAVRAEPRPGIYQIRAEIYQQRRDSETSLMAKGIFGHTAGESLAGAGIPDPHAKP